MEPFGCLPVSGGKDATEESAKRNIQFHVQGRGDFGEKPNRGVIGTAFKPGDRSLFGANLFGEFGLSESLLQALLDEFLNQHKLGLQFLISLFGCRVLE